MPNIFGTYKKSPEKVNGYNHFISDDPSDQYAIWYCVVMSSWIIGHDVEKGDCKGFAHFIKNESCLECLPIWGWRLYYGNKWMSFKNPHNLMIECLSNGKLKSNLLYLSGAHLYLTSQNVIIRNIYHTKPKLILKVEANIIFTQMYF